MPWTSLVTPLVTRALLLGLAGTLLAKALAFGGWMPQLSHELTDFDVFYIAGHMAWRGDMAAAYRFATMAPLEARIGGAQAFMPWTYPPPFDLVVALLARLPQALAYLTFAGATLGAFLLVLRRLAADTFPFVLLAFYPALLMNLCCGQNGFLTASLIGLACLGLRRNSPAAGLPLGAMIIKPHLAVAFAIHAVAAGRWACAGVAVLVAGLLAGIATLAFGAAIWPAFLQGMSESRVFLGAGVYPLSRMVSAYAALRSLGLPSAVAGFAQAVAALLALGLVVGVVRTRRPTDEVLGFTALVSLLVSPYAYDYDLPVVAVGLALLAPKLLRSAGPREQIAILVLAMAVCSFGAVATLGSTLWDTPGAGGSGTLEGRWTPALGGVLLLAWTGSILWVSRRVVLREDVPRRCGAAVMTPR